MCLVTRLYGIIFLHAFVVCTEFQLRSLFIYYQHINSAILFTDIRCDNLSAPSSGEIKLCSSGRVGVGYEGDTCSFACNAGYELTGSNTRTCQSSGSWNGTEARCRRGTEITVVYCICAVIIIMKP